MICPTAPENHRIPVVDAPRSSTFLSAGHLLAVFVVPGPGYSVTRRWRALFSHILPVSRAKINTEIRTNPTELDWDWPKVKANAIKAEVGLELGRLR